MFYSILLVTILWLFCFLIEQKFKKENFLKYKFILWIVIIRMSLLIVITQFDDINIITILYIIICSIIIFITIHAYLFPENVSIIYNEWIIITLVYTYILNIIFMQSSLYYILVLILLIIILLYDKLKTNFSKSSISLIYLIIIVAELFLIWKTSFNNAQFSLETVNIISTLTLFFWYWYIIGNIFTKFWLLLVATPVNLNYLTLQKIDNKLAKNKVGESKWLDINKYYDIDWNIWTTQFILLTTIFILLIMYNYFSHNNIIISSQLLLFVWYYISKRNHRNNKLSIQQ